MGPALEKSEGRGLRSFGAEPKQKIACIMHVGRMLHIVKKKMWKK